MLNVLAIGTIYAAPRIIAHLYREPREEEANDRFYRIRMQISRVLHSTESLIGKHNVRVGKEFVADNAWISYFVVSVLFGINPASVGAMGLVATGSMWIWIARAGLSHVSPLAASYIAPSNHIRRSFEVILQRDAVRRAETARQQEAARQSEIARQQEAARQREDALYGEPTRRLEALVLSESEESKDPILNRFQCTINLTTPRDIVVDQNGISLYERRALSRWYFRNGTSPATRAPLAFHQVHEYTLLQAFIAHRRDFLRQERPAIQDTPSGESSENQILSPLYLQELRAVFYENNIDNFHQIPEAFKYDESIIISICPITDRPVRFSIEVIGKEGDLYAPIYEESAITQWRQEHPTENPPKWPSDIPFEEANLIETNTQRFINQRLKKLLNIIHTDPHVKLFKNWAETGVLPQEN